ncbi:MAG: hypothetical protein KDE27_25360 [Planctomycetes bacterium]|nr:hypothetical protein [Planctomycetota bacterium]
MHFAPFRTVPFLTLLALPAIAQTTVHPLVAPRANYTVVAGSDTGAPSARMWGGSATDGTRLFVFGGRTSPAGAAGSVYFNGLYAFDTVTGSWTTLSPEGDPNAPANGFRQAMAYDPSGNRLVIVGGASAAGVFPAFGTTHVFDLATNTWSTIANPTPGTTGPQEHLDGKLAFDAASGSLVLFGGTIAAGATGRMGETWLLSGTTWTPVTGLTAGVDRPSDRALHAMAARSAPYGDVVLVGGRDTADAIQNDTWRWDGVTGTWSQITPINATVPVSWASGNEVVYDALREVLVINNGPGTGIAPSNTTSGSTGWVSEYDCVVNEWRAFGVNTTTQGSSDPIVGNVQRFFSAFVAGKVLLWAGQNTNTIGDADLTKVKEYQADPLASATPYGSGCNGLALAAGSNPWGGRTWSLTGSGFGPTAVGALGISLAQTALPLPSPGLSGCDLLIDTNLLLTAVLLLPSAGSASYSLALPLDASFGGLPLDGQMFALDSIGVTSSNGIAGVLGAN